MVSHLTKYPKFFLRSLGWVLGWQMLNIMYWLMPSSYREVGKNLGISSRANLVHKDHNDYIYTFCTIRALIGRLHWYFSDLTTLLDQPAPNSIIFKNRNTECRLLDFQKEDRPLVVIFGSLTSSSFMGNLQELQHMIGEFRNTTDFMIVYCQEAHAVDGWSFKNPPFPIKTHKVLEDRLQAAEVLQEQLQSTFCRIVVDSMDNNSCWRYGALPCRLYVLNNRRVAMAGGTGPDKYQIAEVAMWLAQHQC